METTTKTAMMMAAGLLMAAPACGEQFTKSTTVAAPSEPSATTGETMLTLTPMLPAREVVQQFIDHGVTHKDDEPAR